VTLLLIMGNTAAASENRTLSERVRALENAHGNPELMQQLLSRMDGLQSEVQELRGTIEQQGFEIEGLKRRQRDQYLDIDQRLERAGVGGSNAGRPNRAVPRPGSTPRPVVAKTRPAGGNPAAPTVRQQQQKASKVHGIGANRSVPPEVLVDPAAERAAYESAFGKVKNGQYADAAKSSRKFLDRYPNGEFADNAQYWLGEAFYATRNYQVALEAFETLLKRYPNSPKVPDAEIKLGFAHYELKHWVESRKYLEEVVSRYPNTTVARLAKRRLEALRLDGH